MFDKARHRHVKVVNPPGLHARPSVLLVKSARDFRSKITIRYGQKCVSADDILDVLTLGAVCGAELTLTAVGPDADEALEKLAGLFADGFGMLEE